MAISPGSRSSTALRSTPSASISSNTPLSATMPRARTLSRRGSADTAAGLAIAIKRLLEGCIAQTAIGSDERLFGAGAVGEIGVDQLLDSVRNGLGLKARAQDLAYRR